MGAALARPARLRLRVAVSTPGEARPPDARGGRRGRAREVRPEALFALPRVPRGARTAPGMGRAGVEGSSGRLTGKSSGKSRVFAMPPRLFRKALSAVLLLAVVLSSVALAKHT